MLQPLANRKLIKALLVCGIILLLTGIIYHFFIEKSETGDVCPGAWPVALGATLFLLSDKMEGPISLRTRLTPIYVVGGLMFVFGTIFSIAQMLFSSGGSGLLGVLLLVLCIVLAVIVGLEQMVVRALDFRGRKFIITESILLVFIYWLLFSLWGMISG